MAKKVLCIILIMLSTILVLVSCGGNDSDNEKNPVLNGENQEIIGSHTHSFSEWKTIKAATCIAEGSEERVCACGKKEIASVSKIAHLFGEWETVKASTCTSDGSEKRVCACGETETRTVKCEGHNEVIDFAIESDCYNYGLSEGSHCETCGEIIIPQTQTEPSHDSPYGVCYKCNEVTDGDLAARTYVGLKSNALNQTFTTYYDGSLFIEYHFYDYNLDISVSKAYDGKIFIYVTLDLTAEVVDYGPYYSGTGFVEYDVRMNGYSIRSGHTDVSYNAASISWSATLGRIDYIEFELYLGDYYM